MNKYKYQLHTKTGIMSHTCEAFTLDEAIKSLIKSGIASVRFEFQEEIWEEALY